MAVKRPALHALLIAAAAMGPPEVVKRNTAGLMLKMLVTLRKFLIAHALKFMTGGILRKLRRYVRNLKL